MTERKFQELEERERQVWNLIDAHRPGDIMDFIIPVGPERDALYAEAGYLEDILKPIRERREDERIYREKTTRKSGGVNLGELLASALKK